MVMGSGSSIDHDAIVDSANVFLNKLEDCIQSVKFKNTRNGGYERTPIAPREVRLTIMPGIQQRGGYFDVQWWKNGDFKYHYQEEGLQFRFGREADNETIDKPVHHFHPPDDPSKHLPSCISPGHPPERVTLAVIACWLSAATANDPTMLNSQSNPP